MAKRSKIKPGLFRAAGASHDALAKAYGEIGQAYKDLKILEEKAFGPLRPGDTTTALGMTIRNYGTRPQAEWTEDGKLSGFRFEWHVLNKPGRMQYDIQSIAVPEGWIPVRERPGVYRPHPLKQVEIAAMFDAITMPDLAKLPEIMGPSPVISVTHYKGTFPRAYQQWPDIHLDYDTQGNISFVIDAPKDYKGKTFHPEGAIPMTEDQWWTFRSCYGDMYEPFGGNRPQGVPTPDDYKNTRRTNAKAHTRYFLAVGETAKLYADFKEQQDLADKAKSKLMRDWGVASYSSCGDELTNAWFKTAPGPGWVPDDEERNSYVPDVTTLQGLRLKEVFAQLPKRPALKDLQAKLTPGENWMKFPTISNLDGFTFTVLEYPAKIDGKDIIPPPDAIEIPCAVYEWEKASHRDIMCGTKPPKMPPALRTIFDKFISTAKAIPLPDPSHQTPAP